MLPLKLSIKGIYSYQEEQNIDFTNLTSAGLFGIFGAVGSGKSAILECISYAVYGQIERLNSRDNRAYNMLNLQSDKGFINFECLDAKGKEYRFEAIFKRAKNGLDVKDDRFAYEKINGEWQAMETKDGEKIFGLSYANFKMTTVIPQGQFKEFLEMGHTKRTEMLQSLFSLDQYDLSDATKQFKLKVKEKDDVLTGQLINLNEVNEDKIKETEKELNELKSKILTEENKLLNLEQELKQQEELQNLHLALQQKQAQLNDLLQNKQQMEDLKQQSENYQLAFSLFAADFQQKNQLENQSAQTQKDLDAQNQTKQDLDRTFKQLGDEKKQLTKNAEQLPVWENQLLDYPKLITLHQAQNRLQDGAKQIEEINKQTQQLNKENTRFEEQKNTLSTQKNTLLTQQMDATELMAIQAWFSQNALLNNQLQNCVNQIQTAQNNLQTLLSDAMIQQLGWNLENSYFTNLIAAEEQKNADLTNQKQHLLVQKQLENFAQNLQPDCPCPLCGSLEHPQILNPVNTTKDIQLIDEQIQKSKQNIAAIQTQQQKYTSLLQNKQRLEEQLQSLQNEENTAQTNIQQHIQNFTWQNFSAADTQGFNNYQTQWQNNQKTLQDLDKQLQLVLENIQTNDKKLNGFNQQIQQIHGENTVYQQQITQTQQELLVFKWENFKQIPLTQIQNEYQQLQNQKTQLQTAIEQNTKKINEVVNQISSVSGVVSTLQNQFKQLQKSVQDIHKAIQQNLQNSKFANWEEVNAFLDNKMDVSKTNQTIQQYFTLLATAQKMVEETQKAMGKKVFVPEVFEEIKSAYHKQKQIVSDFKTTIDVQTNSLQQLAKNWESKQQLINEQNLVKTKLDYIAQLEKLFGKSAFVGFVASYYLNNLVQYANVRFQKLSKGQLSLTVKKDHSIHVIDYLNGGKERSVKTLSGGQSFQASLCLALGLAESVQNELQQQSNFFFIDEGFGTQDKESLNMVYEVLFSLTKENKVVGFISHLAELQERIPVSLQITATQNGSLVSYIN
jgi:exonuclease SbcC